MDTIRVKKDDLIATLRGNRDIHRETFLKAQDVYREKVIAAFEERLEAARNGEKILTYINLPEPEDHTDAFNTAINMLEWEIGDEVDLDRRDFQRFVQNQWEWGASFAANTGSYLVE
jgi:hypothetical protein